MFGKSNRNSKCQVQELVTMIMQVNRIGLDWVESGFV